MLLAGIIYTTSSGFLAVYGKVNDPDSASQQSILNNSQTNVFGNNSNVKNNIPLDQVDSKFEETNSTDSDGNGNTSATETQQQGISVKGDDSQSSKSRDLSVQAANDEDGNNNSNIEVGSNASVTEEDKNTRTNENSKNQLSGITVPQNESKTSETKSEGEQAQVQGQEQNIEKGSNASVTEEQGNKTSNVQNVVPNNETISQNNTSILPSEETTSTNVPQVDLLADNTTSDEPLPPDTELNANTSALSGTSNATSPIEVGSDTLGQITSPEDILGNQTSEEIDTAASEIAGSANVNSTTENNDVSNIQNVINTIALSSGQSGGDAKQAASQISKEIAADPKGEVAKSIQTLAGEYSKGNSDEINIAAKQIGSLIAKGDNIKQILVQITNKVVNNIKNIRTSIENYDKVIVHPKTSSVYKGDIDQTINLFTKSKQLVDVPQVHIKFDDNERNLVLRVLTTNNYRYDMPFSKYNGAFTLDDNEFRVKIVSGDGSTKAASVAKIYKSGKVGDRIFLDKDIRNGRVFFSLDGIDDGKYLVEVYVKLSNGYIGTFARGSVSIR